MSTALAKVAPLKPEIRLGQVVSEFEADLSTEQKVEFQALRLQSSKAAPDQNDVMRLTAEMDKRISSKFGGQCFGPRFTNFVQGVQRFAALGDILVGGSQNLVACAVWSVVRMSLLSFGMALLYPHSKPLQSSFAEYFIIVVKLCHYIFKFGQKSSVRQFTSSLSDAQLKTFQTDLDIWANSIKEEMLLAEAQENSKFRTLTRGAFTTGFYQQGYASKIRVLGLCSEYDYETAWKQTRKIGNSSFYKQLVEYQEWKGSSNSCTLVYTGKLGSGKSVLMANIVDDLNLSIEADQSLVAYFFCKHDIQESLEARTILGSLNTPFKDDIEGLISLLMEAFPKDRKIYIVLDGVDECGFEQKETLAKALREIQEKLQVLVCVSFREKPDNSIQSVTEQFLATRIVSLPENNPDIEDFIETELERCLQRGLLTIGDPTLILEIQDTLLKGSQGMFLWVALQIKTLCSKKTDHAIREALADLPKDLSGTFERILQKSGTDLSLQTKTLQLVLVASRPLTTDELREALSVVPGDTTWDPSKLLHNVYSALACCGCLLTVDEEEFTIRVVHHSVKQYLCTGHGTTEHAKFSLKDARRKMADIVVTYLCYGVFGTELSRVNARPFMAQPLLSKIVQSTTGSFSTSSSFAIKLLKLRKQSDFDLTKAITQMKGSSPHEKETSFSFYQYANTHWYEHIVCVSGHNATIFRLASRLINVRASTFNFEHKDLWPVCERAVEGKNEKILGLLLAAGNVDIKPKEERPNTTLLIHAASKGYKDLVETLLSHDKTIAYAMRYSGRSALMYAVTAGHHDVVEVITKMKEPDVMAHIHEFMLEEALIVAAYLGNASAFEMILKTGKADINARTNGPYTALMCAAEGGHKDVVEMILKTEKPETSAKLDSNYTALIYAAAKGHKDMVEMILKTGKADINATNDTGDTALICAAEGGYKDVVEMILKTGKADINATTNGWHTALIRAAERGHKDVIEVLLKDEEIDITAADRLGRSALMAAVHQGHKDVVEMLLLTGKSGIERSAESRNDAMTAALMGGDRDIIKLLTSYGASAY
ncbi:Arp Ankyrin repeat protein [Curvularia clavata]|uniref:Arp Ankyrin repeat protein n=1 Tax=Curvularia clavata TaxID=95742 RepID=A0A9Q8YZL9_CURCL|nr:Arp Ankyrin repeat protein [Curvularia clavata]